MRALLLALIVGLLAACGSVTATAQNTATAATATSVPTATSGATATASASTNATVAAASCASPATALTELTEGPYYKANPPQRSTITATGVAGTPFVLTGFVLTKSCAPLANARVDFWQADGNGNYDNAGYTLRGWQLTDANGAYRLETVIPGLYPGRTEHIHVKVTPAGGQTYTTQLFFPGVSQNSNDSIYAANMLINLSSASATPRTGTFNFIVNLG